MSINNLSLRTNATHLIRLLEEFPELLVNIRPPRESTVLTKKPKTGEKVRSGKPSFNRPVDFEAVDLKADLIAALESNDYENMAISYYTLAHLISY